MPLGRFEVVASEALAHLPDYYAGSGLNNPAKFGTGPGGNCVQQSAILGSAQTGTLCGPSKRPSFAGNNGVLLHGESLADITGHRRTEPSSDCTLSRATYRGPGYSLGCLAVILLQPGAVACNCWL